MPHSRQTRMNAGPATAARPIQGKAGPLRSPSSASNTDLKPRQHDRRQRRADVANGPVREAEPSAPERASALQPRRPPPTPAGERTSATASPTTSFHRVTSGALRRDRSHAIRSSTSASASTSRAHSSPSSCRAWRPRLPHLPPIQGPVGDPQSGGQCVPGSRRIAGRLADTPGRFADQPCRAEQPRRDVRAAADARLRESGVLRIWQAVRGLRRHAEARQSRRGHGS